jgi:hypothetical protein
MKTKLLVIVLLTLVACCAGAADKEAPSGKGMELYSWKPAGKDWHFSLILGLNNRKPVIEIADVEKYAVTNLASLKEKLSSLPKGERVYWVNLSKQPLPKEIEKDLRDFCRGIGVEIKPVEPQNKPAAGNAGTGPVLVVAHQLPRRS